MDDPGTPAPAADEEVPDAYALMDLERRIGEDERTAEPGVRLALRSGRVVVRGSVASTARRDGVIALVEEHCPGCPVVDETHCADDELSTPPRRHEVLR